MIGDQPLQDEPKPRHMAGGATFYGDERCDVRTSVYREAWGAWRGAWKMGVRAQAKNQG